MTRLTDLFPFCGKKSKTVTLNGIVDKPHKSKVKNRGTDEYKTSTTKERLYYIIGTLSSIIMGCLTPVLLVAYGELTSLFVQRHSPNATISPSPLLSKLGGGETNPGHTMAQQMDALVDDSIAFFIAGMTMSIFQFIFCVITVMCLNNAALSKVGRMRRFYLKAILKQEMAWHDKQTTGFASSFSENLNNIQEGTGEKIGIFMYLVAAFVSCVIASMFYGWKLTLVMTAICPVFIILTIVVAKVQTKLTAKEAQCYGEAGSVVEEVLAAIRTVVAYGGEDKEVERYEHKLAPAHKIGLRSGVFVGLGDGSLWMLIFWAYSLCFWYGTPLIIGDRDKEIKEYTPGVLLIVLFGVVVGAMNLGFSVPYLEAFAKAKGSTKVVYTLLKRKPVINVNAGGTTLQTKLDEIEFQNVCFSYPARPDTQILKGTNFKVNKGESVALVGSSGSGKSTTIQLIERFYDPSSGTIKLNGTDLKKLDLKWVRSQIGLVGQEPVLFNTTITENICCDLDVSKEDMERAAKDANAHDFIMKLPMGYDTNVGERGTQMSGGQKQRIAIARALIRKPGILLLDEATSALDVANEAIVQQALDKASKGRTTLIISHRLSSIRNVDRIIVMSGGQVVEQGTHSELMELKKHYYGLVAADAALHQSSKEYITNQEINVESLDMVSSPTKVINDNDSESKNSVVTYNENKATWSKLLSLNKPDMLYVITGSLASFFMGCTSPASSVFLGEMFGILSNPNADVVYSTTNGYAIAFIIIGIIAGISIFLQVFNFTIAGVRLVSRLKVRVFSAMLRQEMSWFDDEKHSVGALSAKLSGDTNTVQGATGSKIGTLVQGISTLGVGAVMSLFYSWQMTIICLIWVLLILISLIIEGKVMDKESVAESEALEAASKIAVEAVMSVRTVASLGQEKAIVGRYNKALEDAERAVCKKLRFRGIVFAFGQTCMNFAYSVSMCFGGYLVARYNVPYKNIIIVSEALLFGAWILGHALSFVPNINLARIAAGHLFQIIDRKPRIYSAKQSRSVALFNKTEDNIDYKDVHFAYPTRPDIKILNGLNLSIAQGQTVALVGSSGSGKSTCIQLLQRFYDPVSGSIAIGSKDITSIPVNNLRSELGLVSQEPVLFDRTIAENIAYGDNIREVPVAEVIDAAKRANIHSFIASLPAGYETRLGSQGTQLSGGQKQRIAIARALVRNPRILILDEATSALDTQSEKVVQEALEDARKGRTCIIIAHRLSTIKHVDVICVMNKGLLVEMGSHDELVAKGGLYTQLLKQHSS